MSLILIIAIAILIALAIFLYGKYFGKVKDEWEA